MHKTECPFCEAEISWRQSPHLRQTVICSSCQGISIVSSLNPLELEEKHWQDDLSKAKKNQRPRRPSHIRDLVLFDEDDWDQDETWVVKNGSRNSTYRRSANHRSHYK